MLAIFVVIVLAAFAAMLAARRTPAGSVAVLLGQSVLVTIAAWMIWAVLMVSGAVRVDAIARSFGVSLMEDAWLRVVALGPPLLAGVVFAIAAWTRRTRR